MTLITLEPPDISLMGCPKPYAAENQIFSDGKQGGQAITAYSFPGKDHDHTRIIRKLLDICPKTLMGKRVCVDFWLQAVKSLGRENIPAHDVKADWRKHALRIARHLYDVSAGEPNLMRRTAWKSQSEICCFRMLRFLRLAFHDD